MAQKLLDFDGDQLRAHLRSRGVEARLQVEICVFAVKNSRLTDAGGHRLLLVSMSERCLAGKLGASKTGTREALQALEALDLLIRGRGRFVVFWDRLLELEEVDPLADMVAGANGRSMVGSLDPTNGKIYTNQPNQPNQSPKAQALPFALRMRHLYTAGGGLNRPGIEKLHATCEQIGWNPGSLDRTLALVMFARSDDARRAGVKKPLGWLVATLRDGPLRTWPSEDWFEKSRGLLCA